MKRDLHILLLAVVTMLSLGILPLTVNSSTRNDIFSGYYSRAGNDDRAAKITGNSIYIKFYPDNWVIMLYVPYPYSLSLEPDVISRVFEEIKSRNDGKAYLKSRFDILDEKAIAHTETFTFEEKSKVRFECDSMAPCVVEFDENGLDMIKAGIINKHIIRFDRIGK